MTNHSLSKHRSLNTCDCNHIESSVDTISNLVFSCHETFAATEIMEIFSWTPFYITVNKFPAMPRHLPMHMLIARKESSSPTICHGRQSSSSPTAIEEPKAHKFRASSTKTRISDSDDTVEVVQFLACVDGA